MKALALALDDKVLAPQVLALALALREKSWPWPLSWSWPWQAQGQDFFPKIQATLLTLTVSHNSLPFLSQECFTDLHVY